MDAVNAGIEKGLDEGSKVELQGTFTVAKSRDAIEGFTAFPSVQKREPNFKGE